MKRIALAFLLLPLLFCHAAEETADELILRSTVRKPDLIIWFSTTEASYTEEVIANIDKSAEMLRYQLDLGIAINPSMFLIDIMKARPEKLLITASYTPGEYEETAGIDCLLALKTFKPMNAQLFIGGIQMLATIMNISSPVVDGTGISLTIGNVPVTLQFLADNTILLLGRTSTIANIKEGKNNSFKLPQNITAPCFVTLSIPAELRERIAENLPEGVPPELARISMLLLTINHDKLVHFSLTAVFETEDNAVAISKMLSQLREQASTFCKDEPTLTKYLGKMNIIPKGRHCRIECAVPWQVGVVTIPAAILMPALSKAREKARSISCVSNLKQIGLGIRIYSDENNDMLPAPETWEKDIFECVGDERAFFCPAAPGHKYIYYGKKVNVYTIKKPSQTIIVSEEFSNHAKNNTINICFVDGHVESVRINGAKTIEEVAEMNHFEFIK